MTFLTSIMAAGVMANIAARGNCRERVILCGLTTTFPRREIMTKARDSKKTEKKAPVKTPKEKKAVKDAKKQASKRQGP